MPRRPPATPATPAQLRRLQSRLPDLSVPALLSLREAVAAALERERLEEADIARVVSSASQDR